MSNHLGSLDQVFQAPADPTRRDMVERLVRGPASVTELSRPQAMSLPAVMQSTCRSSRPAAWSGPRRTCHIEPDALRAAEAWITAQRTAWEHCLDRLGNYLGQPRASQPRASQPEQGSS